MNTNSPATKVTHQRGNETGKNPGGIPKTKGENLIMEGAILVLKTKKSARFRRNVEVCILEIQGDGPVLWRDGRKNRHKERFGITKIGDKERAGLSET